MVARRQVLVKDAVKLKHGHDLPALLQIVERELLALARPLLPADAELVPVGVVRVGAAARAGVLQRVDEPVEQTPREHVHIIVEHLRFFCRFFGKACVCWLMLLFAREGASGGKRRGAVAQTADGRRRKGGSGWVRVEKGRVEKGRVGKGGEGKGGEEKDGEELHFKPPRRLWRAHKPRLTRLLPREAPAALSGNNPLTQAPPTNTGQQANAHRRCSPAPLGRHETLLRTFHHLPFTFNSPNIHQLSIYYCPPTISCSSGATMFMVPQSMGASAQSFWNIRSKRVITTLS